MPSFGGLPRREFDDDKARMSPFAFQQFQIVAAQDEPAAERFERG